MNSKCAKRAESWDDDGEDRISKLPQILSVKILGFLPLKDAARTSVLSKPWKTLWLSSALRRLRGFRETRRSPKTRRSREYVEWVTRVLQELRVRMPLRNFARSHVDQWLSSPSSLQTLELDFCTNSNPFYGKDPIAFPELDPDHGFRCLTSLSLDGLKVSDEAVASFLRNLAGLERLRVCSSDALVNLRVCGTSPALKHLEILYCHLLRKAAVRNTFLVSLTFGLTVFDNNPNLALVRVSENGDVISRSIFRCCPANLHILTFYISYAGRTKASIHLNLRPCFTELIISC